jgi:hypothetical protein
MDELLKKYVNKQEYDYYIIQELEQKLTLLTKTNELKTKDLELHNTKIKELDQKYENIIQKLQSEFNCKIEKYNKEFNILSEKYECCSKKLITQSNLNKITHIYTVYFKEIIQENNNYVFLKKAFKQKELAYEYTISKITTLLNNINDEFKTKKEYYNVLPIGAQVIFISYNKLNNNIDKYNYYKENYIQFFRYVLKPPIMFCVSEHNLI